MINKCNGPVDEYNALISEYNQMVDKFDCMCEPPPATEPEPDPTNAECFENGLSVCMPVEIPSLIADACDMDPMPDWADCWGAGEKVSQPPDDS